MSDPAVMSPKFDAEMYERHLVPLTFGAHARIMASHFGDMVAGRLLEIAAGTGALTRELRTTQAAWRSCSTASPTRMSNGWRLARQPANCCSRAC